MSGREYDCPECEAEGRHIEICQNCNGSGEGRYDGTKCDSCGGSGEESMICTVCSGYGDITAHEMVELLEQKCAKLEDRIYRLERK